MNHNCQTINKSAQVSLRFPFANKRVVNNDAVYSVAVIIHHIKGYIIVLLNDPVTVAKLSRLNSDRLIYNAIVCFAFFLVAIAIAGVRKTFQTLCTLEGFLTCVFLLVFFKITQV